ncbi:MAG: gluconate 2-dehydrogenase subunit 3 family protein [Gemmatimonadota bacterium]
MPLTRRDFVARSAFYGSTFWLLWNVPRPLAFRAAQESGERLVLTEDEWNLVEAITGRIVPTDHEPGAIEANCVNFIDKVLAHEDAYLKPTYYRGLPGVDAVTEERFGRPFVELRTEEQDAVLEALESGDVQSWPSDEVAPEEFFEAVRVHTIIGFLADPSYGGNQEYAGWKVVGYPGPRHAVGGYSPEQMIGEQTIRTIWGEEV